MYECCDVISTGKNEAFYKIQGGGGFDCWWNFLLLKEESAVWGWSVGISVGWSVGWLVSWSIGQSVSQSDIQSVTQ